MKVNPFKGALSRAFAAVLLVALAVIVLAACGGRSSSSSSSSGGSSSSEGGGSTAGGGGTEKPKLGLLLALTGIPFSTETTEGAEDAASFTHAELQVAGPPTIDPTAAIKQFEDMVATKPDGITVFPIPAEQWVRPFKTAAEAGIKLDAIHVPPVEGSEVPLYVGMREKEAAEDLAKVFVEELGPEASGEIVLGIGPAGEPVNENRIYGYEAEIEKELPNVKIVGPITTGNEPVENLNNWTQIFARYPNALAYIGTTDQDCGSMAKLKNEGKNPSVLVGAFDPSVENQCLPAIKAGKVLAAVDQQPYIRGYVATRVLAEAAEEGVDVPEGWIDTGILVVNQANAGELEEAQASIDSTRAYYKGEIGEIFAEGLEGLPLKPLEEVALEPVG
jgi:ABC-type sugar transport system substrate-binding protein